MHARVGKREAPFLFATRSNSGGISISTSVSPASFLTQITIDEDGFLIWTSDYWGKKDAVANECVKEAGASDENGFKEGVKYVIVTAFDEATCGRNQYQLRVVPIEGSDGVNKIVWDGPDTFAGTGLQPGQII